MRTGSFAIFNNNSESNKRGKKQHRKLKNLGYCKMRKTQITQLIFPDDLLAIILSKELYKINMKINIIKIYLPLLYAMLVFRSTKSTSFLVISFLLACLETNFKSCVLFHLKRHYVSSIVLSIIFSPLFFPRILDSAIPP